MLFILSSTKYLFPLCVFLNAIVCVVFDYMRECCGIFEKFECSFMHLEARHQVRVCPWRERRWHQRRERARVRRSRVAAAASAAVGVGLVLRGFVVGGRRLGEGEAE